MNDTSDDEPWRRWQPLLGTYLGPGDHACAGGVPGAIIAAGLGGAKIGAAHGAAVACIISRRPPATMTGAIGGAIVRFAWGAVAGHIMGSDIDENVLRFYKCREYGFEFKA